MFHVNKTVWYVAFCAWLLSVIITPHFYTPISSAKRTRTLKIPIPPSRLIPTFFSGCILYFTLGLYCPPLPDRAEQYLLHSVDTVLPTVRFFKKYLFNWLYRVLGAGSFLFFFFFSCSIWTLSGDMWNLVSWPGIEPRPPALGAWSLNHWTTREVPICPF